VYVCVFMCVYVCVSCVVCTCVCVCVPVCGISKEFLECTEYLYSVYLSVKYSEMFIFILCGHISERLDILSNVNVSCNIVEIEKLLFNRWGI